MATKRHRRLALAIAILVIALAVRWRWFPGQAFDPVAWGDDSGVSAGVRLGMADRLVARRTLVGMTRDEVVGMLGQPTTTAKFADWDLVYWLGPERAFYGIDSEWLVVRFDGDGRASESHIARD